MSVPEAIDRVRGPRPLLSRRVEQQLGVRHREVLDHLEASFLADGFSGRSVRELAARVGCSRRTLYELAPTKDDLVLLVLDRFLHRVGRAALDNIDPGASHADQIRAYFTGAVELQRLTHVFAEDLAVEPAARRLFDRHFEFVMSVTAGIVQRGVAAGEFRPVPPSVVAGMLAGSVLYFNQPGFLAGAELDHDAAIGVLLDLVTGALTGGSAVRAEPSQSARNVSSRATDSMNSSIIS